MMRVVAGQPLLFLGLGGAGADDGWGDGVIVLLPRHRAL